MCLIGAQVKSGAGVCSDWLGRRTDRSVTPNFGIILLTLLGRQTHSVCLNLD